MRPYPKTQQLAVCLAAVALILGFGTPAVSEEEPTDIEPKADKVIKQLSDYLQGLDSFRVDVESVTKMEMPGMKTEMTSAQAVALERPMKLAITPKSGKVQGTIICDGETVYTYLPMTSEYTETEAPESIDQIWSTGAAAMIMGMEMGPQGQAFLPSLLHSDPYQSIMDGVTGGKYLGTEEIEGATCHHLKFFQEELDWEIWVETGDKPVIRRLIPDMSKTFAKMGEGFSEMPDMMKDMQMESTTSFSNWQGNVELPEDQFKFTPPADAKKVVSFFESFMEEEGPSPLLGEAAPEFELDLLDGQKLKLADHKGKNIVVLDFWATWCPPCREGLPAIAEVAGNYREKGVAIYAVNLMEDTETIRGFLEKEKLKLTVALDSEGKVGELYKVMAIPTTVIIGKDGSIQAVHEGLLPNLKKKLSDELDALLEGKSLVEETEEPKKELVASAV